MTRPGISVILVTFNHERYVATALEGILAQRTSFGVEIIVSDDKSTDRTLEIIRDYMGRCGERMQLLVSASNCNDQTVTKRAWHQATGKYITVMDGDDYWTSENKLQAQWDYLEKNPDVTACFHDAMILWEDNRVPPRHHNSPRQAGRVYAKDLWLDCMIATCTIVYRAGLVRELPDWYDTMTVGDWPLHLLHAHHGPIGYLHETMAVYRKHTGGFSSGRDAVGRALLPIKALEEMRQAFGPSCEEFARAGLTHRTLNLAQEYENAGQHGQAWRSMLAALKLGTGNRHISLKWLIRRLTTIKVLSWRRRFGAAVRRLRKGGA